MRIRPLFGGGTAGKSYVVTRQRRLNVYFENRKDGDKTKVAVYGTPGLVTLFTPQTPTGVPLRALQGSQTALYLVAYNQFQKVSVPSGSPVATGSLNTFSGLVSLTYSPLQVVIVDGLFGYLFTPGSSTFATIPGFTAANARTVTFVAGFFVAEQPGTQNFWVSNFQDGSTWNALAVTAMASTSDNILAVDNLNGNLVLFGEKAQEFWQNTGAFPQPFAPVLSAANTWGLAAIFSRAHVLSANDQDSIIFLGQSESGQVQLVQTTGFGTRVISDPDTESIWNSFSVTSDATAYTYQIDTHRFYQINFPTGNRSFLYDGSTGIISEVQTGPAVIPTRHIGNIGTYYAGQTLLADYATNLVYTLSPNVYTDNGATIIRQIITRHVLSNFNRIRISLLYLDMETGVGLQTGQGSNPQIMLEYSKDNGRTWSAQRWVSLGKVGTYLTRVLWRRFGSTRDATFRITMSDPVKFVITEGALRIRERAGQ